MKPSPPLAASFGLASTPFNSPPRTLTSRYATAGAYFVYAILRAARGYAALKDGCSIR